MSRAGVAAALAAALVLGSACRPTEWPSDADKAAFCDAVTGLHFTEGGYDSTLERIGTPEGLPFEARRYLIHLDGNRDQVPGDEQVLQAYVADHC